MMIFPKLPPNLNQSFDADKGGPLFFGPHAKFFSGYATVTEFKNLAIFYFRSKTDL